MAPSRITRGNRVNTSASPGEKSTRGFTPPIASAPRILTRRFTRSQSRDADPAGPISNAGRSQQGAKAANAKGLDRRATNTAGRRAAKSDKRGKANAREDPDLSMVPEDPGAEDPHLQQDDPPIHDKVGARLILSGLETSELAKLNHIRMIESLADLFQYSTDIIDFLVPPRASEGATSGVAKKIRAKESFESKYFELVTGQFILHKHSFGSKFYLDLSVAIRALSKVPAMKQITNGPWRSDDILYKANLTVLAVSVLPSEGRDKDIENVLEDLDRFFPTPFLSMVNDEYHSQPGSSSLYMETFNLALEIRTQYLISQLTKESENPNFIPSQILQKIFFTSTQFREWNIYVAKKDDKLTKSFTSTLTKRINLLKLCIRNEIGNLIDLGQLERLYPWSDFISNLASWIRSRADEIDDHVKRQGGIEEVVRSLGVEAGKRPALTLTPEETTNLSSSAQSRASRFRSVLLQSPESVSSRVAEITASQTNPDPPIEPPRSTQRLVFGSPTDVSFLKRLMLGVNSPASNNTSAPATGASQGSHPEDLGSPLRLNHNQPSNPTTQHKAMETNEALFVPETQPDSAQPLPDDDYQPNFGDDQGFGDEHEEHQTPAEASKTQLPSSSAPPAPSQQSREIQAGLKSKREEDAASQAPRSKQRSFYDRQDTAQRLRWESQTRDESLQQSANGKRSAAVMEESEDEFQSDDRNVDIRPRRQQKPAPRSRPPPREQDEDEDDDAEYDDAEYDDAEYDDAEDDDAEDDDDDDAEDDDAAAQLLREEKEASPGSDNFDDDCQEAKTLRAANRSPRGQKRIPWTTEEIDTLKEGLIKCGNSWSKIKYWDQLEHPGANDGRGVLAGREQGALRDKARNMKVTYLSIGKQIPLGFEEVGMYKKEIARVEAAGRTVK